MQTKFHIGDLERLAQATIPLANVTELNLSITTTDMEDFPSFVKIKSFVSGLVDHISGFFDGVSPIVYTVAQRDVRNAISKIQKIKTHNMGGFAVIVPEGLIGGMVNYLQFLNSSITEISSIDARLLRPLEMWAGNIISNKEYKDKIWVNTFGDYVDLPAIKNRLKKFFSPNGNKVPSNTAKYYDVYFDNNDLQDVNVLISKLIAYSDELINSNLHKRVVSVAKLLHEIVNSDTLNNVDIKKLKPIIDITGELAAELELLSILIFQVKAAGEAYTQTIAKINTQLS